MRIHFTKMQGAGNDFVVLDGVRQDLSALDAALLQRLGDRRFGVGADQILLVQPAQQAGADFRYRIFNGSTGAEVQHCGNGARCFARYVRDQGLIDRDVIRVDTVNNRLELRLQSDGRVTVDMGAPRWQPSDLPFDPAGLTPDTASAVPLWTLDTPWHTDPATSGRPAQVQFAALSMGNPHAVIAVDDVERYPVADVGAWLESHPRFAQKVNVGFAQTLAPGEMRLRVFERDAGETLACGTGACAAAVAGMALGRQASAVEIHTRGGDLRIAWAGGDTPVLMTGPAETVFEGHIDL
ncbi:diaminopimelate epimerase [Amphibiibacter pelophylacis]|uniref:Diaminopimelate epimerase n=1 Tax=Amphibiibacter pelophylacis TaxID=1799477 RepID=A0ACC6P2I0_9BURK